MFGLSSIEGASPVDKDSFWLKIFRIFVIRVNTHAEMNTITLREVSNIQVNKHALGFDKMGCIT